MGDRMIVEPYTKTELEHRRCSPITTGARTVAELAALIQQGQTYRQIAALWGMRPQAGKDDLQYDICNAWEDAGSPGGIPLPTESSPWNSPEWNRWRSVRDAAVKEWLALMPVDTGGLRHCLTCTCH